MNAEQIFNMIKELENGERWKLLDIMYDEYYNIRNNSNGELENIIEKLESRINNLEVDVEFLAKKSGRAEREIYIIKKLIEDK
ncbi:hypothetical protein [Bacillus weihaiensis]|uniref:hypothetical protein n=1 Tax=Bacillus weihaiensis TaxID=1547283 RepID=UPI0023556A57|nr:hypothetical protein [Bacillus weihaiensis]